MKHFSCYSILFVLSLFFSTQFSFIQAQCFDAPNGIAIDVANGLIYWSEIGNQEIRSGNLDGSGGVDFLYDAISPRDVAIDATNIYWAEINEPGDDDVILAAPIDGSGPIAPLYTSSGDGLNGPNGIEVNPATGDVYWGEVFNQAIVQGNNTATDFNPLFLNSDGAEGPRGIAIDIAGAKIYWADFDRSNKDGKIFRGELDGTGTPTILFDLGTNTFPHGLAIDLVGGLIYWTDVRNNEIIVANLDGTGTPTTLFDVDDGVGGPRHLALDAVGGKLYWAEREDSEIVMGNADGTGTLTSMFVKLWDGEGDGTTWGDDDNWSDNTKPVAGDKVVIPINTDVTIDGGSELAGEVFMELGSSLTIDDGATLTVDNDVCFNGVKLKEDAELIVNGTLDILNAFDDGLDLTLNSEVTIGVSGTLTVTDSFEDGIDMEGAIFTNNGTITINNTDFAGIDMESLNGIAATFTNNGTINIDNSLDEDEGNGIDIEGSTFNNFGTIGIDNSENDGIRLGYDHDGLISQFVNEAGGSITIDHSGDDALELEDHDAGCGCGGGSGGSGGDGNAKFVNKGDITITTADDIGLNVQLGTTFINNSSIILTDMGAGIDQSGGVLTNNSELSFTNMFVGVFMSEGTFANNCTINIEDTEVGVANTGGIFNNNGFIDIINLTTANEALLVVNQVNNNTCGVVNVQSQHRIVIEDTGTLTNDGIITTEFTGDNEHNNGAFVNNGEVRPAAYSNTGNAITGNAPVAGTVPAIDALNGSCNANCPISVVPTLSEWGLLILALLLMTFGTVYLMQPMYDGRNKCIDC